MPGSGKTIITSVVINHLTSRIGGDPTIGIAYLYCTYKGERVQTTEQLLASVLGQLARGRDPFPASTKKLYDQHKTHQTEPSREQLVTAIEAVANLCSKVYMVIDAIDEGHLPSIRQFVRVLFELQASCNMSIFATSRSIPEITQWFEGVKSSILEIRARSSDITKYLETEMQDSSTNVIEDNPEIQQEVKAVISKAADGM